MLQHIQVKNAESAKFTSREWQSDGICEKTIHAEARCQNEQRESKNHHGNSKVREVVSAIRIIHQISPQKWN